MAQFTHSLCEEVIRTHGRVGLSNNEILQMATLALRALKNENPFLVEALRYRWLVENPGLAMLAFAEATNVDTFGVEWKDGKPVREVTSEEYCRYLHARIDELMQERREPQSERE